MGEENRRSVRRQMFRVCRYNIQGREYADLSTNISSQGIFIKNSTPPAVGTLITLWVTLPQDWGGLPLQINGKVTRVDNDPDVHKRGMGIQFLSVVADSLPIIEYFVREVYQQPDLQEARLSQAPAASDPDRAAYRYHLPVTDPPQGREEPGGQDRGEGG
ncbi:MAG TPA: PilZ domain-containing protein [Myxococcota bacterium]|nr:PilZ domain-containing protein [Myxococcota bacterium]HRY96687.1 PilZ domain-containing protein [Myxococcota bacterium]HSA20575.1 PilZ domain-containing protein [Myxococcota bacterium]